MYMSKVCDTCIGIKLADMFIKLDYCLNNGIKYDGVLIDSIDAIDLNRMCSKAKDVNLGGILDNLFMVAKYGGTIDVMDSDMVDRVNDICYGTQKDRLGSIIQDFQKRIVSARKEMNKN